MRNTETLAIVISVIILGIAVAIGLYRNKKLSTGGKIIKRNNPFYREEQIYRMSVPFPAVLAALNQTDFSDAGVTPYPNYEGRQGVLFKSKHGWNAVFDYTGLINNVHTYSFSFPVYKTRNGVPWRLDTMNMMLTALEKSLLSLDYNTTVETHAIQVKTKTSIL